MVLDCPTRAELMMEMSKVEMKIGQLMQKNEKLFFMCYFAGHGIMDTTTKIILNSDSEDMACYPLEGKLRAIASSKVVFTVGLFDCCRVSSNFGARGVSDGDKLENYLLIFGCCPSKTTRAKSTLVVDFFNFIEEFADKYGHVMIPHRIDEFRTQDNMNETVSKVVQKTVLYLKHSTNLLHLKKNRGAGFVIEKEEVKKPTKVEQVADSDHEESE